MHRAFYLKCIIKMEYTISKYSTEIPPMSIRHLFLYQTVGMNVHCRHLHLYIKPLYQPKILRLNVTYHFFQWYMKKLILKDMALVCSIRIYLTNSSIQTLTFQGLNSTTSTECEIINCKLCILTYIHINIFFITGFIELSCYVFASVLVVFIAWKYCLRERKSKVYLRL